MTHTTAFRRIVTAVAVAFAIATAAGSASARTFDVNSHGSVVLTPPPSISHTITPATSGSSIDWGYIAIGSGAAALALIGVGAVASGRRRSHQDMPRRATIGS